MTHASRPITRDPEEEQIAQQLKESEARLVDHYVTHGEITEDHVRHTFGRVAERFLSARIRTFLPILIERAARELER
ncbi:three-helix bundle dimerization domain-containing protein [Pseudonocardia sp. Cha107L01]|jgi:hypothetical protein|uniref:three-helix bundle dimerization domain-containing protein n=1 Tax=Pseudonocardia sp. Cha107L01 TaxID=3457576 RepID=UPI00403E6696